MATIVDITHVLYKFTLKEKIIDNFLNNIIIVSMLRIQFGKNKMTEQ